MLFSLALVSRLPLQSVRPALTPGGAYIPMNVCYTVPAHCPSASNSVFTRRSASSQSPNCVAA